MHFFLNSTKKDLLRRWRDPLSIAIWIGVPLIIGLLIILAFGRHNQPQAHILIADEDHSFLSRMLMGVLSQDAVGGVVTAEEVETESGLARINRGEATALLVIPPDFSNNFLLERPSVLKLVTNPAQSILPDIVEEMLSTLVDAGFYIHRLIGDDLKRFAGGPPGGADTFPDSQVADFSVRINRLANRLSHYLDPRLISLESSPIEDSGSRPQVSTGLLFIPSILFMSLLFMAQGISTDLWLEHEGKTLRRVLASPQRIMAFLLGKLAAGAIVVLLVCLIGLSIGYAYFSLDPVSLPLAALWSMLSGTMLMAMMMLIQLLAASQRGGEILTLTLIFPLMMAGGSFFPFEAMPAWMAAVGRRTPNGWALERLKSILIGDGEAGSLGTAFLILAAVTMGLFVLGSWRLRRKFGVG
jgi:ABC-type multidrug transport system permease subunit